MDVRCARCGIEYEFDDALISERGTMVRCTECGHQFRVHPSHVIPAEPDEWRVVTSSGRTIVFRTLRELQQGISHGEVGRDATLLRGRQPPRPLGSIAELDPFFPSRAGANRQQSTLTGVAPPATAPPPGPGHSPTTGKVPIARVGLSPAHVANDLANAENFEVHRAVGQRRTAIGIGAPMPVAAAQPEPNEQSRSKNAEPCDTPSSSPENSPTLSARSTQQDPGTRKRGTSDPPTLRQGETPGHATPTDRIAPSATKPGEIVSSMPPRPQRRTRPTPAAGTGATALVSTPTSEGRVGPVVHEKPTTEPPHAQRSSATDSRLFEQVAPALEHSDPPILDEGPRARLHAVRHATLDVDVNASEHHEPNILRTGSESLESPRLAASDETQENGAFVPTVPPLRVTNIEALRASRVIPARGSRVGRWLVVILLGVLVSLVVVWNHYQHDQLGRDASSEDTHNLERWLQNAREALRVGDLVLAHENLQASQASGARDARWLTLTARYDIMRADMNWLAVRLADPSDTVRLESLKRELSENVAQSGKALSAVEGVATDSDLVAARLDAQRLSGETDKARQTAITLQASHLTPDLAYSLAGAELVQPKPRFKEIFEWLGEARAVDAGLGRAPVMLVLACVAGNRMENAQAEVQRLKLATQTHPLLAEIEAFVSRATVQAITPKLGTIVDAGMTGATDAGEGESIAEVTREGDFRLRLRRAVESLGRNELTRAEQLFRSVLTEHPKDTEALAGLGDVARRHGNAASAISYYERVLSGNGQYLPALSALADIKWKNGDRAGAAVLYRRIADQVGDSPGYGQTAAQRLRELSDSTSSKSNAPSESGRVSPAPAASRVSPSTIDTTDLPGKTP